MCEIENNYERLNKEKRNKIVLNKDFEKIGWDLKKEYLKIECNVKDVI